MSVVEAGNVGITRPAVVLRSSRMFVVVNKIK